MPLVDFETLGKPGKALADALRHGLDARGGEFGRILIASADKTHAVIDRVFNKIPKSGRDLAFFKRLELNRQSLRNSGPEVAQNLLAGKHGFLPKSLLRNQNSDAAAILTQAIDNPDLYLETWVAAAKELDIGKEYAEAIVKRWNTLAEMMAQGSVKAGVLDAKKAMTWKNRYIPHMVRGWDLDDLDKFYNNSMGPERMFKGGDMHPFSKARVHDNIDELQAALDSFPDLKVKVEMNPVLLMQDYITRHVQGIADAQYAEEIVGAFAQNPRHILRNLAKDGLVNLKVAPKGDDLELVSRVLSKGTKLDADDLKRLGKLEKGLLAHYIYEASSRTPSLAAFSKLLGKLDPILKDPNKFPKGVLTEMGATAKSGRVTIGGQKFREFPFTEGPLKGRMHLLPDGIVETLRREGAQIRLTPEWKFALDKFDLLVNSFKLTHTAIAPAFHARNAISNYAAMIVSTGIASVVNPRRARDVYRIWRGEDFTIKASNGMLYSSQQVKNLMRTHDILPQRLRIAEYSGEGQTLLDVMPIIKPATKKVSEVAGRYRHENGKLGAGLSVPWPARRRAQCDGRSADSQRDTLRLQRPLCHGEGGVPPDVPVLYVDPEEHRVAGAQPCQQARSSGRTDQDSHGK